MSGGRRSIAPGFEYFSSLILEPDTHPFLREIVLFFEQHSAHCMLTFKDLLHPERRSFPHGIEVRLWSNVTNIRNDVIDRLSGIGFAHSAVVAFSTDLTIVFVPR